MFFIFAGNASRIEVLHDLLAGWLAKSTLLVSTLSCQFISNVPSAILLSRFTDNYRELLLGVNIGGTGTLIASLASLITYSEFKLLRPGEGKKYLGLFTLLNVIFLAVLTAAAYFFFICNYASASGQSRTPVPTDLYVFSAFYPPSRKRGSRSGASFLIPHAGHRT